MRSLLHALHQDYVAREIVRLLMKYHFVFVSSSEKKVLEFDTDEDPPKVGYYVHLPLGQNEVLCQYRVTAVHFTPVSSTITLYYFEVQPS